MKISEVYPEYVFQRLGKGLKVVAIDFNKGLYIDLGVKTVMEAQKLLTVANVKFFQLEEE